MYLVMTQFPSTRDDLLTWRHKQQDSKDGRIQCAGSWCRHQASAFFEWTATKILWESRFSAKSKPRRLRDGVFIQLMQVCCVHQWIHAACFSTDHNCSTPILAWEYVCDAGVCIPLHINDLYSVSCQVTCTSVSSYLNSSGATTGLRFFEATLHLAPPQSVKVCDLNTTDDEM